MERSAAPLYHEVAGGPPGGTAMWLQTGDGLRIRAGVWRPDGEPRGTVFLFPGRTEFVEKYGDAAREFAARGLASIAVDWRGQGLADRLLADRRVGHVLNFADYQQDVAALVDTATELELPRPWSVLGHSMGGAIGFRAVAEGMQVESCAFTGPMWGIFFTPIMKPISRLTTTLAPILGQSERNPPTTTLDSYVMSQEFDGNTLTRDPDMYAIMRRQLNTHPELALGAPSIHWLREALAECRYIAGRPSPDLPCLTFLGGHEQIVDRRAIRERMARWPRGTLIEIPDGEHEVLMEPPAVRLPAYEKMAELFANPGASGTETGLTQSA